MVILLEGGTEFDLKALDQAAAKEEQIKGLVCLLWTVFNLFLLLYYFALVSSVLLVNSFLPLLLQLFCLHVNYKAS